MTTNFDGPGSCVYNSAQRLALVQAFAGTTIIEGQSYLVVFGGWRRRSPAG
jgi:hypothetical protein